MQNDYEMIKEELASMNTFEKFINQVLTFAQDANDSISETEDEAINAINAIMDLCETALDKKEYLKWWIQKNTNNTRTSMRMAVVSAN